MRIKSARRTASSSSTSKPWPAFIYAQTGPGRRGAGSVVVADPPARVRAANSSAVIAMPVRIISQDAEPYRPEPFLMTSSIFLLQEAVASSRIEGVSSSLEELLIEEALRFAAEADVAD